MRIFLTDHAQARAKERVISPSLAKGLFSKALHDLKKGKRGVKSHETHGESKLVWNGWQFVYDKTKWTDKNGTLCEGVTLITVYPTHSFHNKKLNLK
jgi:hypothetical protein